MPVYRSNLRNKVSLKRPQIKIYLSVKPSRRSRENLTAFEPHLILKSRREMTKEEREAQITQTVRDLLVKPPHSSLMCTRPPRSVRHNRAFILDTSTEKTLEEDLLADDCGVWLNNGQPRFFYERSGPGNAELTRAGRGGLVDETSLQKPWIVVHRHYCVNKSCPEFRRTVTFLKGMACL